MGFAKKMIYFGAFLIFIGFMALMTLFFLSMPSGPPEGYYITPGNAQQEWLFTILIIPLVVFLSGIIGIYIVAPIFSRFYISFMRTRGKIGLAPMKERTAFVIWRKMWARALVLGLFVTSLAFSLSNQLSIVEFMRINVQEGEKLATPNPEVMFQLIWLVSIPATLLIVPIWIMVDAGIVKTKKIRDTEFEGADLAARPIYRIIKGYIGIGFLYNFLIMMFWWITPNIEYEENILLILINVLSPLMIIAFMFPLVIFLDAKSGKLREKMIKRLKFLKMDREINMTIELKKREDLDELEL